MLRIPLLRLFMASLILTVITSRPQAQVFSVGPIEAARGEKASGEIVIPAGVDEGTIIPITVIHGSPAPPAALSAAPVVPGTRWPAISSSQT